MACWDNYPPAPNGPPGARLVNGQIFVPVEGQPCVMRDPSGAEWEAVTTTGIKPETSPTSTQLSDFPQFPVFYRQDAAVPGGGDITRKIWKLEGDPTGNAYDGMLYALIASRWIDIASALTFKAADPITAAAWVARFKREMSDEKLAQSCTLLCGDQLRRLYLIANAAAYVSGYWADQSLVPPKVPSSDVIKAMADKLTKPIGALASSDLGLYALGALALLGFGYVATRKK